MGVLLSSILLAVIFLCIILAERKCSRRSKEFFARASADMAELSEITQKRYRNRFGKDPTGGFPLMTEEPQKNWLSRFTRRK